MKGPSPFSADQYAPLLRLWGIRSLKHKGGVLHKDPNNGSPLTPSVLYAHFPPPPLQLSSPREGALQLVSEAGNVLYGKQSVTAC